MGSCTVFRPLPLVALLVLAAATAPGRPRAQEAGTTTIAGRVAAVYQVETSDDRSGRLDGGIVPFTLFIDHATAARGRFHAALAFAAGRGVGPGSAFLLPAWGGDTEDDLRDINGRNRDHLLTAWYRHALPLGGGGELAVTGGIVDGTDYLDGNAFANDEYTQFMNSALVNGPNFYAPSYDPGAALELDVGSWSLRGLVMEVGPGETGRTFRFYGVQAGYRLEAGLGAGNYRVAVQGTDAAFSARAGEAEAPRRSLLLSADQEVGRVLGLWVRAGTESDEAVVTYRDLVSGGIHLAGAGWGRPGDDLGLGAAYLAGVDLVEESLLIEGYYRIHLAAGLAGTLDVQNLRDRFSDGRRVAGWVYGVRLVAAF